MKENQKNAKRPGSWGEDAASTATLATAGIIGAYVILPDSFFESTIEAIKQGRHAARTIDEIARGTEGQRATQSLLEANLGSETYYAQQIQLIDNLANVYRANENIGRQVARLGVQLKGMVAEATVAGDDAANALTGNILRKIDDAIMNIAGDARNAREGLEELQEIARTARQFYDGREKFEDSVGGLMKHLENTGLNAIKENEGIKDDVNSMITQLDRTYNVEDKVFEIHERTSFLKTLMGRKYEALTKREKDTLSGQVREYRGEVDELRTSVEQHAPIGEYREPLAWIDYAINPVTLGLAGAFAIKGFTRILPCFIERPLTKTLALPMYLVNGAIRKTFHGARSLGKKILREPKKPKELKEPLNTKNGEDAE